MLSADSRFPDLRVGDQMEQGNHFLALFPASTPTRQMEREAEEARAAKRSSKSSSSDADSGNLRGRKKWHAKDLVLERARGSLLRFHAQRSGRQPLCELVDRGSRGFRCRLPGGQFIEALLLAGFVLCEALEPVSVVLAVVNSALLHTLQKGFK